MMKYFCGVLLTLLVGYGQGQTLPICKTVGSGSSAILNCTPNHQLECLTDTPDQLRTKCVLAKEEPIKGIWQFPHVEFEHCTDTVYFHGKSKTIKDIFPEECLSGDAVKSGDCRIGGDVCTTTIPLEPPDVPAIQEDRQECVPIPQCNICNADARPYGQSCGCCSEMKSVPEWTCAEKDRVLLHTENGKYWCHKPESSLKP